MNTSSKNYNRRAGTPSLIVGLSLAVIAAIVALIVSSQNKTPEQKPAAQNSSPQGVMSSTVEKEEKSNTESKTEEVKRSGLEIRYIDVGQGDSTLVMLPDGKNLLIDAGTKEYGEKVVEYLKGENIERLDYVIATNPNEENIGGLAKVINTFEIGRVYAPDIDDIIEDNSYTSEASVAYDDFKKAISEKKLKILSGRGGTHIYFSLSLTIDLIAPNIYTYSEINNYSIAVKIKYGQQSFIFMGDAENYSEQEILDEDYDIAADVIKIGNHGSSTSSGKTFIKEVKPKYAVISCGKDNKNGYPHQETLKTLEENEVRVFRTDLNGTISLKSDGMNELKITSEKQEKPSVESSKNISDSSSDESKQESEVSSETTASDKSAGESEIGSKEEQSIENIEG